jgi:hypothetical protein
MSEGVNARDLSEDDLRRELAHAKEKGPDIESEGTPHQKANLVSRTAQLEQEFLRRNPGPETQGASASDQAQPDTGATGATTTDDTPTDDAPTGGAPTDAATGDTGTDDSAPGAAADSSAPAVAGEPEHDPTRPEESV